MQLHPLQFQHFTDQAQPPHHVVEAQAASGEHVGLLKWHATATVPDKVRGEMLAHTVTDINVPAHEETSGEPLRRRGIARGMWEHAQTLPEPPVHSPSRTPDGNKFARAVGGRRPMTAEQLSLATVGLR